MVRKEFCRFAVVVAALLVLPAASAAQTPAADVHTGVQIGEKAPDFILPGHDGKRHALADYLSRGKVALVFYRSATW